jgi:CTP:molybdopterin cytidylyltransferase MocA
MQVAAAVLTGGRSNRMGQAKALLELQGRTFLDRVLDTLVEAGIVDIVVVTGEHDRAIREHLDRSPRPGAPVQLVANPDPSRGQLSSLHVALDTVEAIERDRGGTDPFDAILVALVDFPLVRASTVRALLSAAATTGAPVTRPVAGLVHGHPVVFARETFGALRAAPAGEGARAVVHAMGPRVCNVAVDDPGTCEDIDTPEAYERIKTAIEDADRTIPGGLSS